MMARPPESPRRSRNAKKMTNAPSKSKGKDLSIILTTTSANKQDSSALESPRSRKRRKKMNTIISMLGIIIVFSMITNIFFWSGNTRDQAIYYGRDAGVGSGLVGNMRRDAAWSPIRYGDEISRRVSSRDGKLKRRERTRDSTRNTHGDDNAMIISHVTDELSKNIVSSSDRNDMGRSRKRNRDGQDRNKLDDGSTQNYDREARKRGKDDINVTEPMHFDDSKRRGRSSQQVKQIRATHNGNTTKVYGRGRHDQLQNNKHEETSAIASAVMRHASRLRSNEKRNESGKKKGPPRHRSFQPHPMRGSIRSTPWSLSLPTITESIKFKQLVLLDGGKHSDTFKDEAIKLKDWLVDDSGVGGNDHNSDDEGLLAKSSETVVWENGEQCVPMSKWQKTVHVRVL